MSKNSSSVQQDKQALLGYHEWYVELVDVQAQLESGIGDEAGLESRKQEIRQELIDAGLDPDDQPDWLVALSDQ